MKETASSYRFLLLLLLSCQRAWCFVSRTPIFPVVATRRHFRFPTNGQVPRWDVDDGITRRRRKHSFCYTSSSTRLYVWNTLHPWIGAAVTLGIVTPAIVAAIQGGASVLNFRRNYADAPVPLIPSHGLVIATNSSSNDNDNIITDPPPKGPRESLKLLLIGDSLAVAVGQSVSATPVMPETIATVLSQSTGKSIYWTCFGETGASTPWIIRMIEEANVQKYDEFKVPHGRLLPGEYLHFPATGLWTENGRYPSTILEWKQKLCEYRRSFRELYFDPDSWGTYDIVILLTGTNDLKSVVFPFLLDQEDKELRRQIKNRKGGVIADVRLFMETLNRKMERGWNRTVSGWLVSAEEFTESVRQNLEGFEEQLEQVLFFDSFVNETDGLDRLVAVTKEKEAISGSINNDNYNGTFVRPLFALPGSPIRLVPAFQRAPLKWFARPVFDMMDAQKKAFATSAPNDILFVEDPDISDAIEYEAKSGRLWNDKQQETVLLSLRAISKEDRTSIESEMKAYYDSKDVLYDTVHTDIPLAEWPGRPGSRLFSVDTIHPNEAGYDMWGRHIGKAIAARLEEKERAKQDAAIQVGVSP